MAFAFSDSVGLICGVEVQKHGQLSSALQKRVHHEVLPGMDGVSVSDQTPKAIETLRKRPNGRARSRPEIQSDNGSCYVSREFCMMLKEKGHLHLRILPHCYAENGLIARANRTMRESLEDEPMEIF